MHKVMGKEQVLRDLYQLYPGADREKMRKKYYKEKTRNAMLVLCGGLMLACGMLFAAKGEKEIDEAGRIIRPDGIAEKQVELTATIGDTKLEGFTLYVAPRNLTAEELQSVYDEFVRILPEHILGENISLNEVCMPLSLIEEVAGYPFQITWSSTDYRFLTEDGNVIYEKGHQHQIATACVSYGEKEWMLDIPIVIVPRPLSGRDKQYQEVAELLTATGKANKDNESFVLPEEYEGERIVWEERGDATPYYLVVLSFVAAVMVYIFSDHDLHRKNEEKRELLQKEYPFFLMKLSLYMEAGLPLRSALMQVTAAYQKRGKEQHPLCMELVIACNELGVGVSEGTVYEQLGRRIDMPVYLRLSMLLSQNLRKGSSEIRRRLLAQAQDAITDNLQYHKKKGEEAQTMLLVPMMGLLLMVMVLVMLPAFYGMNM